MKRTGVVLNCRFKMLCFCQYVSAAHDSSHLDVWTFTGLEISKRLFLFRFCVYKVSTTEEELSMRCVCFTQNLCCHKHTILKFLLIWGYPFLGRNSDGDGAQINSDSIVSLEMKLRMCFLSNPECSYIVCKQLGSNGC